MSRSEYLVLQLRAELERVTAERDESAYKIRNSLAECLLLTHKIITCGIAAERPELLVKKCYSETWASPQSEKIAEICVGLRAELARVTAERDELRAIKSAAEEWRDQPVRCIRDERDKTVARDILAGRGPTP